jgi:hypothetical protein
MAEKYEPRAQDRISRAYPQGDEGAVLLHERHADPQAGQDRPEHGRRRSRRPTPRRPTGRCKDLHRDCRARSRHHQGPHLHRRLQAARRHADRRQGHPARRPDVRVPGPPDQHRAAARSRFPWSESEELRRPWQLRHGSRSTSCSRRSTTTRSIRCGAWTSSSARRPRPTTKPRALLKEFNFPFASKSGKGLS